MKFKITLDTGQTASTDLPVINSVEDFTNTLKSMAPGTFLIVGKVAIAKDHIVLIEPVEDN